MMNHKGYVGILRVDHDAGVLRGKVVNTRDTITFQGRTVEEAESAFRESVDDYLEFCASEGVAPEKPFSGRFVVRVKPEVHRALSVAAQSRGVSVNKLISGQLGKLVRHSDAIHGGSVNPIGIVQTSKVLASAASKSVKASGESGTYSGKAPSKKGDSGKAHGKTGSTRR